MSDVELTIFGSQEAAKSAMTRKTQSGSWRIPSGPGIQVRFLTEEDAWGQFREFFDPITKTSRALKKGEEIEGKATRRILATVLLRDEAHGDKVVPLKLPMSLAKAISTRGEKYGTLTDRDYVLFKQGEGLDTTYGFDAEAPSKVSLSKYDLPDLLAVLNAESGEVSASTDVDDDEDLDIEAPAPAKKSPKVVEVIEDDLDDEVIDDDVVADDGATELSLADLKAMSVAELKSVAAELRVSVVPGMKKSDLINEIWEVI
ncbi:Rho termination factor, N-terminal [uncultured Caudovirales phage]|uniref:Rho termination factor, N-terminal n=1 Tax=uncultured Caudovirales phage TaxID=2100421 RepID=A0A6J5Q5X8_9CAUD|nr:Rho termination factor, N-terminal [uncultured Caudovirales phage]